MLKKLLKFTNDNHWYIIAGIGILFFVLTIYGCQSTTESMITPGKKINREELQLELDFLIGRAKMKVADLDDQDAVKQAIMDQAAIFAQTGTLNPAGLITAGLGIGSIAFGLNRNQAAKKAKKETVDIKTHIT